MVSKLDQYLAAATRENTRRSYEAATRHFEVEWGGCLPASPETIARYLADFGDRLAANTLRQRLAAIASWHTAHGFVDPTRAPIVKQTMRGIQTLHPRIEKRATPLQLRELGHVADWLEQAAVNAKARADRPSELRHLRDRALILLGFWRGFRSDELITLRAEHVKFIGNEGLHCFLGHSKGDRDARGALYKVPALSRWCAVGATRDWLEQSAIADGPVFRKIDHAGHIGGHALHANSVVPLLRAALARAGLEAADYSSHSLRRGFAGWASANGWDVKSLMAYVGWRDVHSAMRYVDARDPFQALEPGADTPAILSLSAPDPVPRPNRSTMEKQ